MLFRALGEPSAQGRLGFCTSGIPAIDWYWLQSESGLSRFLGLFSPVGKVCLLQAPALQPSPGSLIKGRSTWCLFSVWAILWWCHRSGRISLPCVCHTWPALQAVLMGGVWTCLLTKQFIIFFILVSIMGWQFVCVFSVCKVKLCFNDKWAESDWKSQVRQGCVFVAKLAPSFWAY